MARHIRRQARKLPSLKTHGFSAFLLLAILILSGWTWLELAGRKTPKPTPAPDIALPQVPSVDTVQTPAQMPDLLAKDNIPKNVNPTDPVVLEGAPKPKSTPKPKPKTILIPKNPPRQTQPTGPLLIDGRPVSGTRKTITKFTPLARAPFDGMSRMSPYGPVPNPDKSGKKPVIAYAKPFSPKPNTKYMSLVIGGLGLNPLLTRKAINQLPGAVTLSFAASAPGLQSWINQARAHGHEVLIELPIQGEGVTDTHALGAMVSDSTNLKNLDYLLSRGQGYFAVTNYGGSALLEKETALLPIIKRLKTSGLGFVYDGLSKSARIEPLATREGVPVITANTYLDEFTHDAIDVQKAVQALQASSYEYVPVGMGFSYAGTIDGVANWLATKPAGVDIAPLSYAMSTR